MRSVSEQAASTNGKETVGTLKWSCFQTPPALLIVDLQHAIDDPSWGPRNNLGAEVCVARLLAAWRRQGWPIIHIRHDSTEPTSTYRPGQPGNRFKPEAMPLDGETVIAKRTNSAFIDTELQTHLQAKGIDTLVIAGVSTSNSVDATVRMAGNLGYKAYLVEDACFTFARRDWSGLARTAQEVHDMALAILDGEYCTVIRSAMLPGMAD
ncbi:cysteine hydrolase family protein [Chitinimonas sp.]|uniref:cysteine hydrolase family protein n=1 Tax=Chitinimonas sp. TaxID=1934313 RepID=UPI002F927E72